MGQSFIFLWISLNFSQFRSVAQSCLTLCNPMNRSTPGLPVHHQLPEFTQTHVHRVSDAYWHLKKKNLPINLKDFPLLYLPLNRVCPSVTCITI